MRYMLILLGLLWVSTANAMDCEKVPDCESLGYSTESDPNCAENGYMYCPFDRAYKKCVQYNCAKLGFTESDKSTWCGKIVKCKGNKNFTACKALCEVGDVYYADGTCGYVQDYDGSKPPVGVVFYVTDNGRHGKVINLYNLGRSSGNANFDAKNPYNEAYSSFQWGDYGRYFSSITYYDCSKGYAQTIHERDPLFWDGVGNTKEIATSQGNNLQYAASVANAFYPPDIAPVDSRLGAGRWYLPSLGEWMEIEGYNYDLVQSCDAAREGWLGTSREIVNKTLRALATKGVKSQEAGGYYWSSSAQSGYNSWKYSLGAGYRTTAKNTDQLPIRVCHEF